MPADLREAASTTSDTLQIVEAQTDDNPRELILLADHAITVDGHAIGFLPYGAYHDATRTGRLFSLFRNGDRVGFILWSCNQLRECRILQIWIRKDARLIEHGRALVAHLENKHARRLHLWQLRAWVATDLEANLFWPQIGFQKIGWRWGPARRSRRHYLWVRPIVTPSIQPANARAPQAPTTLALETPQNYP